MVRPRGGTDGTEVTSKNKLTVVLAAIAVLTVTSLLVATRVIVLWIVDVLYVGPVRTLITVLLAPPPII